MFKCTAVNPYSAKFLKWNNPPYIFGTFYCHFLGENLKLVSQQYRAWSDCTNMQAGLVLFWWQRLITFGSIGIRVKILNVNTCGSVVKGINEPAPSI